MPQDWRTVKVFISSTFRDMQAERDHLVRFAFPRLREELLKRRIHLVDVDLRWGVTSELNVLEVCQEIIDECRPRFLCILGGRYGWTPPGQEESITAQEIRYAVLHHPEVKEYRFFYFRDPQVTAAIPDDAAKAGGYREYPTPQDEAEFGQEEAELRARRREEKLKALKQDVIDAGFIPCCYPARWDEAQHRLVDLKAFGDQVYDDLLWSVKDEFPHRFTEPLAELDEFAAENAAMEAFVQERSMGFVVGSRQSLFRTLTAFAEGEGPPNVLAVSGTSGSGKSALLARFYLDYIGKHEKPAHPQDLVIPHFIGASPGSTDLRRTLRRFCHELAQAAGVQEEIPKDLQELVRKFPELLKQAAAGRRVVLLIDALNQMDTAGNAHAMYWLPYDLPANVRFIVSSLDHPALEALQRRGEERVREKNIKPMDDADRYAIIIGFLNRCRKRMTGEQITALLSKKESGNPLYLLTALEELRTLGTYEEITERIEDLPDQVLELFQWIFKRLEDDPGFQDREGRLIGKELVRGFVSLLGVSRYGLSQMELAELLAPGDPQAHPPVPPDPQGNVAALLCLLRPYLMQRGELLDFYHGQLRSAAEEGWLKTDAQRQSAHYQLAGYFEGQDYFLESIEDQRRRAKQLPPTPRPVNVRKVAELPWHRLSLSKLSRNWDEVGNLFTNLYFLEAKVEAGLIYDLMLDFDRTVREVQSGHPLHGVLRRLGKALRLNLYFIGSNPTTRDEATELCKRLLDSASNRRRPRVMTAISTAICGTLTNLGGFFENISRPALNNALNLSGKLTKRDFSNFGSDVMSSRTKYYDADVVNRESLHQMIHVVGAPGAHIDSFDEAPYKESRHILEIFLCEALTKNNRLEEARQKLAGVIARAKEEAYLPDIDGVHRYSHQRDSELMKWILSLCIPLAGRLGLPDLTCQITDSKFPLSEESEITIQTNIDFIKWLKNHKKNNQRDHDKEMVRDIENICKKFGGQNYDNLLTSRYEFEKYYRFLCEVGSYPSNISIVSIGKIINIMSEQQYNTYLLLIMLILRVLIQDDKILHSLQDDIEQKSLKKIIFQVLLLN